MDDLFIPKKLKDLDELLSEGCAWDYSEDCSNWRLHSTYQDVKLNSHVNVWAHNIDIRSKSRDLTRVLVGVVDNSDVVLIGFLEMTKTIPIPRYEQYNFLNDRPNNCSLPFYNGDFRDDRSVRITEMVKPYFDSLMELKPEFSESLEKCMSYLDKHGPKYKP